MFLLTLPAGKVDELVTKDESDRRDVNNIYLVEKKEKNQTKNKLSLLLYIIIGAGEDQWFCKKNMSPKASSGRNITMNAMAS